MSITLEKLKKLPDAPGVYLFLGPPKRNREGGKNTREVLYVGKATSLKSRVRSYLSDTAVESRGPKILKLIEESTKVDFEQTDTVLEALIREAALIKQYQPIYNAKEKSDKSFNFVVITDEAFPRVFVMRERELLIAHSLKLIASYGPFPNSTQLYDALKIIRKIFPYRGKTDAPTRETKRRASKLYEEMGLAPKDGGAEDPKAYGRTIKQLRMFFEGKKTKLVTELEREMKRSAKAREFEVASEMKRRLFALNHINDIALMKRTMHESRGAMRIEAYDVAHTSGTNVVGVMTVVEGGEIAKNEYRMFKIKGDEARGTKSKGERFVNDTGALSEMLERRFGHSEWAYPKIIVVDGSTAQINAAMRVLDTLGIKIPVVSVVKDERHRPLRIMGDAKVIEEHGQSIILANNEAHRFAVAYHRRKRGMIH